MSPPYHGSGRALDTTARSAVQGLLFDMDDTLIVEQPLALAAFQAVAEQYCTRLHVSPDHFVATAREQARLLWHALPTHPYCKRVGIASWEGLWADFMGPGPEQAALRALKSEYQQGAWQRTLEALGKENHDLAAEMSLCFRKERRRRSRLFPDTLPLLEQLGGRFPLALITNGSPCLQREKLAASGLAGFFRGVIISGDYGTAKPDPELFHAACRLLGCAPETTLMLGNSLEKDIAGAQAVGMPGVWLNREERKNESGISPRHEIASLDQLDIIIQTMK